MREILFRGFCENFKLNETVVVNGRKFHGEWVYGYFVGGDGESYDLIQPFVVDEYGTKIPLPECEVIPETVGQFTGLLDKNGKQGFEHDAVKRGQSRGVIKFGDGRFYIDWEKNPESWSDTIYIHLKDSEVIGTIFDVKEGEHEG